MNIAVESKSHASVNPTYAYQTSYIKYYLTIRHYLCTNDNLQECYDNIGINLYFITIDIGNKGQ